MMAGWAFVVASMVACGPVIPQLPSQGGSPWWEVTSEHVTLWTDASIERGRKIVRDLELRRQVILTAMGASSRATAFVIALRSSREVEAYRGTYFVATAWGAQNPTGQAGILLNSSDSDRDHIVSHEMAHVVTGEVFSNQPPWLAEGIATYFEMVDFNHDDTGVTIGFPRRDRISVLHSGQVLSAAKLFSCIDSDCRGDTFYATSWAVFSLLLNEHYDELVRYLRRLNDLRLEGWSRAWYESLPTLPPDESARRLARLRQRYLDELAAIWRDTFPDLPPEKLDIELFKWLRNAQLRLPRIEIAIRGISITSRALREADVLAARGFLSWLFSDHDEDARSNVERALAIERTNVLARLVQAKFAHTIAPDEARATAAAHPGDWRALRLVELALHDSPDGDEALAQLCAMSANTAPECAGRRVPREPPATAKP